ncbi:MAG: sigma-54-dependent Fis family transcriptional regulator [Clostridiales Family XIII bacterium]|jgi:transcriptional regulator of acetoin/glycerol metabolism|nr:sigma-54-dependent Fis family transcriptional regulator [Clostridiales Family XIII bacterium]
MFRFDAAYGDALKTAWSHLLSGARFDETTVRPTILASWKRSLHYGVNPHRMKIAILNKADIRERVGKNEQLIKVGNPYMKKMYSIVEGSGFYLMLCDKDGIVLDLIGDSDIIEEGRETSNLVVGANRSEPYAGTNAIGTCLTTGEAIQVWGDEHFVASNKKYCCCCGPIRSKDGEIIGCLNLTGLKERVHAHTLGMVICAVDGISKELKMRTAYSKLIGKVGGFTAHYTFEDIIGKSATITQVLDFSRRAAKSSSNILIMGESGTGKELVAHAIHNSSSYASGPFVAINCGALPIGLIESELFGYEGGTFTGANKTGNPGKFELADGGTIFLDEIGDMPLNTQASLLRVIQTKEIVRLGAKYSKHINVRIIAATNKNLPNEVRDKNFREDLYYRLNVITLNIPPLREREEDIYDLAERFVRTKDSFKHAEPSIAPEVYAIFKQYPWPGNVRELENVIERALNIAEGDTIRPEHLPDYLRLPANGEHPIAYISPEPLTPPEEHLNLKNKSRSMILSSLQNTDGNIKKAAELLGISRRTLYRKMEKYKINYADYR